MTDEVIALRCAACGEMNRDIGYNPEYKTSFWCGSCGQPNDIKIKYYSVIQTKDDYRGSGLASNNSDTTTDTANPPGTNPINTEVSDGDFK